MAVTKDAFVIMPFSATKSCTEAEWGEMYDNIFKPALEACGYVCERLEPTTGSLIKSIINKLKSSRIVLADITDRNPNVFYELGVRHSLSKRTIIICQNADMIPSDLRGYWSLQYGIRPSKVTAFKKAIKNIVSEIEADPDRCDSPVADYLEQEHVSIFSYVQRDNIKKLGAFYTELTGNSICLRGLLIEPKNKEIAKLITYECLMLLLQTLYIDVGPNLLKTTYELFTLLRRIESGNRQKLLLKSALQHLVTLSKELLAIREKLILGEYQEPRAVSTMEWKEPKITESQLKDIRVLLTSNSANYLDKTSDRKLRSTDFLRQVCQVCLPEMFSTELVGDRKLAKSKSTRAKSPKPKNKAKNVQTSPRGSQIRKNRTR